MVKTFAEYLIHKKKASKNTVQAYSKDISDFLTFIKTCNLEQITKEHINHYFQQLDNLKPATLYRKRSALKAFFIFLNHPLQPDLDLPVIERELPVYMKRDDVSKIIRYAQRDNSRDGVQIALLCILFYQYKVPVKALRLLKKTDIDYGRTELTLQTKTIKLSPSVIRIIRTLLQEKNDLLYLFTSPTNQPLPPHALSLMLKRIAIRALGIKRMQASFFIQKSVVKKSLIHDSLRAFYHTKHPRA